MGICVTLHYSKARPARPKSSRGDENQKYRRDVENRALYCALEGDVAPASGRYAAAVPRMAWPNAVPAARMRPRATRRLSS